LTWKRSYCSRFAVVIPGKLAIASATRDPRNQKLLDTRFRGYDGGALADLFCELWFQDTR
jgi:hypothetical protein